VQKRLCQRIDALADNPRPAGVVKLSGSDDIYRVRIGDYRIIYEIQDIGLIVLVLKIGHRRAVYK
jgi:mRNA interferase RelE/StbE